jgi:hypothetical protein
MFAIDLARYNDAPWIPSTDEYTLMLEARLVLGERKHVGLDRVDFFVRCDIQQADVLTDGLGPIYMSRHVVAETPLGFDHGGYCGVRCGDLGLGSVAI